VVTNCDHLTKLKYSPTLSYAFTEHGALMLGNALKSARAVEVSLMVVRTFVHLRELVSGNKELAQKLNQLEHKVGAHDRAIAEIINAIRELMTSPDPKKKHPIGFAPWEKNDAEQAPWNAEILNGKHQTYAQHSATLIIRGGIYHLSMRKFKPLSPYALHPHETKNVR